MSKTEIPTDSGAFAEILVTRIVDGDKEAEQQLVTRYWRGLYFILHHNAKDPDLAWDIAQDTFVVVLTRVRNGELEKPAALKAFIRQIGINLLLDHYRKTARRKTQTLGETQIDIPTDSRDFYHVLNSQSIVKLVRQLIDELKVPRDREILLEFYLYEKDKAQVCETLELSGDNFDKVLHRARERFKQLLMHKVDNGLLDISAADVSILILTFLGGAYVAGATGRNTLKNNLPYLTQTVEEIQLQQHLNKQVMQSSNPAELIARRSGNSRR